MNGARTMIPMGSTATLFVVLIVAIQGSATAATGQVWRLEPLVFDDRLADTVGPKRSGSLCLPAGSISWREAKPDGGDGRDAFAAGLRAGGLAMGDTGNPFGGTAHGADRALRTVVRGVRLSACVPPGGWGRLFNHGHAIKGSGVVAVRWRAYARDRDAPILEGATCVAFTYDDRQATLVTMMLAGLEAAGRQVAANIVAEGRMRAAETRTCRDLSHRPGATFMVADPD